MEADVDIIFFSWYLELNTIFPGFKLYIATLHSLYTSLHYTMHFVYYVSLYANAVWVVQYKNFELLIPGAFLRVFKMGLGMTG